MDLLDFPTVFLQGFSLGLCLGCSSAILGYTIKKIASWFTRA